MRTYEPRTGGGHSRASALLSGIIIVKLANTAAQYCFFHAPTRPDLNLINLLNHVIPACFRPGSSDLRRWMPASAGMTCLFRTAMRAIGNLARLDVTTHDQTLDSRFRGNDAKAGKRESGKAVHLRIIAAETYCCRGSIHKHALGS